MACPWDQKLQHSITLYYRDVELQQHPQVHLFAFYFYLHLVASKIKEYLLKSRINLRRLGVDMVFKN